MSPEAIAYIGGAGVQGYTPPQPPGWRLRLHWLRHALPAFSFFNFSR